MATQGGKTSCTLTLLSLLWKNLPKIQDSVGIQQLSDLSHQSNTLSVLFPHELPLAHAHTLLPGRRIPLALVKTEAKRL